MQWIICSVALVVLTIGVAVLSSAQESKGSRLSEVHTEAAPVADADSKSGPEDRKSLSPTSGEPHEQSKV